MRRINISSGPDIKEGWTNTDIVQLPGVQFWNILEPAPTAWHGVFDYALINHTLCLLSYDEADIALQNIRRLLKPDGILEVIDMDALKAIDNLKRLDSEGFKGHTGNIEEQYCKHLIGYGRKSLYTAGTMKDKMMRAGFRRNLKILDSSENDLRPKESLIVQGQV